MQTTVQAVILPWVLTFAAGVIPALFALLLAHMSKRHINTAIVEALGRAAGKSYMTLMASGHGAGNVPSLNAAIAVGRDYLINRVPDALKSVGITPESAAAMVEAELGKLLAQDPSVSVAPPKPPPPPPALDVLGLGITPGAPAATAGIPGAARTAIAIVLGLALLAAAVPARAAPGESGDGAPLTFKPSELRPITDPANPSMIAVLPSSVQHDAAKNRAAAVIVQLDRAQHRGVALFTVFDCGTHVFAIQLAGRLGNMGDRVGVQELLTVGPTDSAMSSTAASPWGEAAEAAVCKP